MGIMDFVDIFFVTFFLVSSYMLIRLGFLAIKALKTYIEKNS